MKTNLFFGLALLSMAPNAVSAQENSDSLYIRNSVYMLKLDMPADNEEYAHAYEVTNKISTNENKSVLWSCSSEHGTKRCERTGKFRLTLHP